MIILVSNKYIAFQCLDLLISMVREKIFISWKVVVLMILDTNPLHRFGLLPTWFAPLQVELLIAIIIIMIMILKGTLAYF